MTDSNGAIQLLDEHETPDRVKVDEISDLRSQIESSRLREKNLEHQLKMFSTFQEALNLNNVDLESIYNQVLYKDARIVELNNIIMEKERQIMDLQELCREQSQVAQSKNLALQIVNKRLKEFDERNVKDASTETDFGMDNTVRRSSGSRRKERNESPGRAVPQIKLSGNGSPPPIDPSEDQSSYTTETATYTMMEDDELNREWSPSPSSSSPLKHLRKYRKRVTFDLKPTKNAAVSTTSRMESKIKRETASPDTKLQLDADFSQTIIDLTTENDQLRKIIAEIERTPLQDQQFRIEQLEEEVEQATKDGKNQVLRARAAAQARIKELEGRLLELQLSHAKEINQLSATSETMQSSREWAINENARLVEQIASLKSKLNDLREELDASLETNASYRQKLDAEEKKYEAISIELKETRRTIQQLNDEKQIAYSEVERLKEALFAQDEFISLLEGDLIVYEAHIGILRDSLGASKKEDRQIIKSKAFAAKLNALEMEKQQIVKKNNDERLRIKALNVKIKCLENERDEYLSRLKYYEEQHGVNPAFHSSSQPVLYHPESRETSVHHASGRVSETPPTAEEQQNDHNQHVNELQHRLEWTQHHLEAIQAENFKLEHQVQKITHDHSVLEATLQNFYDKIHTIASHVPSSEIQNVENNLAEIENLTRNIVEENNSLKTEKESLIKDLDMARHAVLEMEHVGKDVLSLKAQMEQEKLVLEQNWREVKNMLVEKEKELADAEDKHTATAGQLQTLEQRITTLKTENDGLLASNNQMKKDVEEKEVQLKGVLSEIESLRETIQKFEPDNSSGNALQPKLTLLLDENEELKQTIAGLRSNMEHYKVEAELSRSCLEDLRNSGASVTYEEAAPKTQIEQLAHITAQEALQQSVAAALAETSTTSTESTTAAVVVATQTQANVPVVQPQADASHYLSSNMYHQSSTYPEQAMPLAASTSAFKQSYPQAYSQYDSSQAYMVPGNYPTHMTTSQQPSIYQQPPPSAAEYAQPRSAAVDYHQHLGKAALTEYSQHLGLAVEYSQPLHQAAPAEYHQQAHQASSEYPLQSTKYYSVFEADETTASPYGEHYVASTNAYNQNEASRGAQVGTASSAFVSYNRVDSKMGLDVGAEQSVKNDVQLAEEVLRLQKQKTDLEEELKEMKNGLNQVEIERSLQVAMNEQLRSQIQEMKSQIDRIEEQKHVTRNVETVDMVQIQILRETVESLQKDKFMLEARLADLEAEINQQTEETAKSTLHMVDSEFDLDQKVHVEKRDASTQSDVYEEKPATNVVDSYTQDEKVKKYDKPIQCDLPVQKERSESIEIPASKQKHESTSSVDTKNLYETIEEEHRLLLTCVTESSKLEEHLSTNVNQLLELNNELETAVDVLKAEIWSLNAQLRKVQLNEREEILVKLTNAEQSLSTIHKDNQLLRNQLDESQKELLRVKEENDRRSEEIRQLQAQKAQIETAYANLSERFEAVQQAYTELLDKYQKPKCDNSTDPLVYGAVIDNIGQLQEDLKDLTASSAIMKQDLDKSAERIKQLQNIIQNNLIATRETLVQLKDEQIYCLRATVVSTINEIKAHLLDSFGQIQDALLKGKSKVDSQNSTQQSHAESEKLSRAIKLCEEICSDIEKGHHETSPLLHRFDENSLESLLLGIREKWQEREQQLRNNSFMLEEEKQITLALQQRLKEAEHQIKHLETVAIAQSDIRGASPDQASSTLVSSAIAGEEPHRPVDLALQLRILAAKLTIKQADNDALFRATAELAHTNVQLQNEIEELQEKLEAAEQGQVRQDDEEIRTDVNLKRLSENGRTESLLKETLLSSSKLRLEVKRRESSESGNSHDGDEGKKALEQPEESSAWNWSDDDGQDTRSEPEPSVDFYEDTYKNHMSTKDVPQKSAEEPHDGRLEEPQEEWKWDSDQESVVEKSEKSVSPTVPPAAEQPKEPEEWKWSDNESESVQGSSKEMSPAQPVMSKPQEWGWGDDEAVVESELEVGHQSSTKEAFVEPPKDETKPEEWRWGSDQESEPKEEVEEEATPNEHQESPPKVDQTPVKSSEWGWDEEEEREVEEDVQETLEDHKMASVQAPVVTRKETTATKVVTPKEGHQNQAVEEWGWDDNDEFEEEDKQKIQEETKSTESVTHVPEVASQEPAMMSSIQKEATPPEAQQDSSAWAWEDEDDQQEVESEHEASLPFQSSHSDRETTKSQASSTQQEWKWSDEEEEEEDQDFKPLKQEAITPKPMHQRSTPKPETAVAPAPAPAAPKSSLFGEFTIPKANPFGGILKNLIKSEPEEVAKPVFGEILQKLENTEQQSTSKPAYVKDSVQNPNPPRIEVPESSSQASRSRDNKTPSYRPATPEDLVLTASKFRKRTTNH